MTSLERQMELMGKWRCTPDELFGKESGQPGLHPAHSKKQQVRVSRLRKKALAELQGVKKGLVKAACQAFAARHKMSPETVKTWLRVAAKGCR